MADFKGGYAIIDLEGKSLSDTPTTIGGIYAALADAYRKDKPVFLVGLTGGNATFAQLVKLNGTSFKLPGIYGKDITVTSQDKATAADAGGGAQTATWFAGDPSIGYYEFVYEIGMTFTDFESSTKYNSDGIISIDDGKVLINSDYFVCDDTYDPISPTSDIFETMQGKMLFTQNNI